MAPGSGKDYQSFYGFALTEEECAIADLFHLHVTQTEIAYVHLHPHIPAQKLENAKRRFALVPYGEAVLCLLDATVFGSAKDGLLVTVRSLYWKNSAAPKSERRTYTDRHIQDLRNYATALDEIENALVQAEENRTFLTGLGNLYRKEDRKPN